MMMRIIIGVGLVLVSGCVAGGPARVAAPAAREAAREEFVFPSTISAGNFKYACTAGAQGGGPAARAAAAHATFEQELAVFSASQTAIAQASLAAGRSGETVTAESQAAGNAFAADQRTKLDSQYGCVRAGQV
jgi:hypothetical protein